MNDDLRVFYGWVRRSREILFGYCTSLPPEIYTQERPDFAFGSMRNLHAHVADCYLWWVGTVGLGKPQAEIRGSEVPDVAAMRAVFAQADAVVEALHTFLTGHVMPSLLKLVPYPRRWEVGGRR